MHVPCTALRNQAQRMTTVDDRLKYHRTKKMYKSLIQRKKRNHQMKVAADVEAMQTSDPQAYWKFWKCQKRSTSPVGYIIIDYFTNYYIEQNKTEKGEYCDGEFLSFINKFTENIDGNFMITENEPLNDYIYVFITTKLMSITRYIDTQDYNTNNLNNTHKHTQQQIICLFN